MKAIAHSFALCLLLTGCISLGHQFSGEHVTDITVGTTTMEQIQKTYGPPTRVGYSNGLVAWTYMDYYVSVFGGIRARELYLTFDGKGKVASYNYNTNEPDRDVTKPPTK